MVGWRIALWVALVMATLAFLYLVRSVLLPFVLAFLIAILLDPTIRKLRLRGWSQGVSVMVVFVVFFGTLTLIGVWATPTITSQVANLRTRIESLTTQLANQSQSENFFVRWNPRERVQGSGSPSNLDRILAENKGVLERLGLPTNRRALVEQYVRPNSKRIADAAQGFFNSFLGIIGAVASQVVLLLFTPLIVFFLLMDMENFKKRTASWIPPSIRASTISILNDITKVIVRYLRGVTLSVMIYTACVITLLTVLGVPYSVLLGLVFGAVYLIPLIGGILAYGITFLVVGLSGQPNLWAISFSSSWTLAAVVTIVYAVFGILYDQIVHPQLVGRSVGLHPVASMFVIFCGGALFGLLGMILAFPLAGSVKVVLDRLLNLTSKEYDSLDLPAVPLRHRSSA